MHILLTGSSGRIGRAIHARLARVHTLLGIDRVAAPTTDLIADIGDAAALRRALHGVDAVVHCAALHAPHVGVVADAEFERVNVQATRRLAELAVAAGVRSLIYTSTTALYGCASHAADAAVWVDEALPPRPTTIYQRTKLAAEQLLEALAASGKLQLTVLRMSRCFPEPAPQMAMYRLHRGVDARDVADAHALALQPVALPFRRFLLSGVTPFQRDDLVALKHDAAAVLRQRVPDLVREFIARGWPLPRSMDRVYAPQLAMQQLRWTPRYGYAEVIEQLDAGSNAVLPPVRG